MIGGEIDATVAAIISSASGRRRLLDVTELSAVETRCQKTDGTFLFICFYFFIYCIYLFNVFIDLSEVTLRLEQNDLQAPFRRELIPVSGGSEERMERNVCAHLWV